MRMDGHPGGCIPRDIAEQVAVLYWPQVLPYRLPGSGSAVELRQITGSRAAILRAVSTFRHEAAAAGDIWHLTRQRLPGDYESMLDQVEVTVASQPLPRLQAVGSTETVFPLHLQAHLGTGGFQNAGPPGQADG
jgi:hypothetical protein